MTNMFMKRAHVVYVLLRRLVSIVPSLDSKLRIAHALGTYAWKNQIGIYADRPLEEYLIGLAAEQLLSNRQRSEDKLNHVLHVLSSASHVGGHTRVVEQFSSYRKLGPSEVLIVGSITPKALQAFEDRRVPVHQIRPENSSPRNRIASILDVLLQYKIVILHIHPDDIETTVAAGLAKKINEKLQVAFYHHADHVFSYGYSVADRVLEITWLGWSKRTLRNTEGRSSFVGIPLDVCSEDRGTKKQSLTGVINLISVGSSYKYKPDDKLSFFDFMDLLFDIPHVQLSIIGVKDSDSRQWALCKEKYGSRLHLMGLVPSSEIKGYLRSADIYVDSFPLSGGVAFPEGLIMCGVALAPRLPIAGFTPADLCRVDSLSEMVKTVRRFAEDSTSVLAEYSRIKELAMNAHADKCVEERLYEAIVERLCTPPPWPKPDYAEYDYFEDNFRRNGIFNNEYSWSLPQPMRFMFRMLSGNHSRSVKRLFRYIRGSQAM